jgi:threonine/homoserine/homoserine lactone efflux protein
MRSFAVAVSNPKGYLFFLALLPAFIRPQAPALEQYVGLAVTFAAIDAVVLLAYAGAGALGAAHLGQAAHSARLLDRLSGLALLVMAAALAVWKRGTM